MVVKLQSGERERDKRNKLKGENITELSKGAVLKTITYKGMKLEL
jgi:hypothetical protein